MTTMNEEEQYEEEIKYMEETFPDCKFSICIPKDELDNVISKEKTIILKHGWFDYYIDVNNEIKSNWKQNFYVVSCDVMSIRNIINELIKQEIYCEGDHQFLECIKPTHVGNETQFDLWYGS